MTERRGEAAEQGRVSGRRAEMAGAREGEEKGERILSSSKAAAGQGDTRCLKAWAGLPGCLADWGWRGVNKVSQ